MSSDSGKATGGRAQQAGQTAKEETSALAGKSKDAAAETRYAASDQVKAVTGEAREQAGAVAHDLRGRVGDEAQNQAQRASGVLHQWADDLASMADNARDDSPAHDVVARAADSSHRAAHYLDERGIDGLVEDTRRFARRKPAAFLGGAVLAGLVVGRLARSGGGHNGSGASSGNTHPSAKAPGTDRSGLPGEPVRPERPGYPEV